MQAPFSNILAETCVLFSNSLAWVLILDGPDFLNCLFSCGHYLALPCLLTLLADFAFETGIHDNKGVWRARQLIPLFQLPPPSFQLRWCLVQWLHIEPIVEIVFWMIIPSIQSSYASKFSGCYSMQAKGALEYSASISVELIAFNHVCIVKFKQIYFS